MKQLAAENAPETGTLSGAAQYNTIRGSIDLQLTGETLPSMDAFNRKCEEMLPKIQTVAGISLESLGGGYLLKDARPWSEFSLNFIQVGHMPQR
jgi:hypothetical protein